MIETFDEIAAADTERIVDHHNIASHGELGIDRLAEHLDDSVLQRPNVHLLEDVARLTRIARGAAEFFPDVTACRRLNMIDG